MYDSEIAGLLHDEHVRTLGQLQRLENFLKRQGAGTPPDRADASVQDLLRTVAAMAANEVEQHFAFEEEHLFPVLVDAGDSGMVEFLIEEHSLIRPLAEEAAATARRALDGEAFSAESWRRFHRGGLELCERELFHIQKEEMGLLAAVGMLVDPEADARLAAAYRNRAA